MRRNCRLTEGPVSGTVSRARVPSAETTTTTLYVAARTVTTTTVVVVVGNSTAVSVGAKEIRCAAADKQQVRLQPSRSHTIQIGDQFYS